MQVLTAETRKEHEHFCSHSFLLISEFPLHKGAFFIVRLLLLKIQTSKVGERSFQNADICNSSVTKLGRIKHTAFVFIWCIRCLRIVNR